MTYRGEATPSLCRPVPAVALLKRRRPTQLHSTSWSVTHHLTRQARGEILDDWHALSFVLGALEAKEDVVLPQRAIDAGVGCEVEALTVLHVLEMDVDERLRPPQAFAGSDYRRNVCLSLDGSSHRLEQHQRFRVGKLGVIIRRDDSNGQIVQRIEETSDEP
jgi:hypothetical protein